MDENRRALHFRFTLTFLAILLVGTFWLTIRMASDPVSLVVNPSVPMEDKPVRVTFKLNNLSSEPLLVTYQFYANSELLAQGASTIASRSSESHQYCYRNAAKLGEQLNFVVMTQSENGDYQKVASIPSYPPQVWSSFVSFASFSTTVMSSISTITYYQNTFGSDVGFNLGLLFSVVLIGLLIFLELSQPLLLERTIGIWGRLRIRFSTVTWILFIIFMSMVYTRVIIILTS